MNFIPIGNDPEKREKCQRDQKELYRRCAEASERQSLYDENQNLKSTVEELMREKENLEFQLMLLKSARIICPGKPEDYYRLLLVICQIVDPSVTPSDVDMVLAEKESVRNSPGLEVARKNKNAMDVVINGLKGNHSQQHVRSALGKILECSPVDCSLSDSVRLVIIRQPGWQAEIFLIILEIFKQIPVGYNDALGRLVLELISLHVTGWQVKCNVDHWMNYYRAYCQEMISLVAGNTLAIALDTSTNASRALGSKQAVVPGTSNTGIGDNELRDVIVAVADICADDKQGTRRSCIAGKLQNYSSDHVARILTEAVQRGLLAFAYPSSPRHPKQYYLLTASGEDIISSEKLPQSIGGPSQT